MSLDMETQKLHSLPCIQRPTEKVREYHGFRVQALQHRYQVVEQLLRRLEVLPPERPSDMRSGNRRRCLF